MVSIKFLSALSSLVGAESCVIMTKVPISTHATIYKMSCMHVEQYNEALP